MNRKVVASIVGVVFLAGVVGLLVLNKPASAPSVPSSSSDTSDSSNMPSNMDMSQQSSTKSELTDKVTIKDFAYVPATITVKKGTKVTWTNQDSTRHDVTPDSESDNFKASELLSKGESYSFTFNTAGTYTYHCGPHPQMKGTVIVTE